MGAGGVSEPLTSPFGIHVVHVISSEPATVKSLDEVKDQIKAAILPSKQQEVFQKVKADLKKNAKIEKKL